MELFGLDSPKSRKGEGSLRTKASRSGLPSVGVVEPGVWFDQELASGAWELEDALSAKTAD